MLALVCAAPVNPSTAAARNARFLFFEASYHLNRGCVSMVATRNRFFLVGQGQGSVGAEGRVLPIYNS